MKIPYEFVWTTTERGDYLTAYGCIDRYIACATDFKWTLYETMAYNSPVVAVGHCTSVEEGRQKIVESLKLL